MTACLEEALAHAAQGRCVFQLSPATKRPYPGTRGQDDATCDPEVIRRWWADRPEAWLGLPMHQNNLIAIDCDVSDGKQGIAQLESLENLHGPLPRTNVQRSGRGGLHIVLRNPGGAENWTRRVEDGGTCRGDLRDHGAPHVDVKNNGYLSSRLSVGRVSLGCARFRRHS